MADLPSIATYMQVEEVDERAPVSESMLQKLGQSINYILDQADFQAVGSIDMSDLTEAQYQAQRGTGWILADGRNVAGSKYGTITGNTTVPDMRGMFPRMKDFSAAVSPNVTGRNPDGNLALGSYQADSISDHNHPFSPGGTQPSEFMFTAQPGPLLSVPPSPLNTVAPRAATFTVDNSTGAAGHSESRPLNRSMNWFVRIN
jgi:hypothetical protein